MKIQLSQSEIGLTKRQTLSLRDGAGVRIEARCGVVWVTQDHDVRDIVLRAGESFTLDAPGQAIVQALEPARLRLTQVVAASAHVRRSGWADRVRDAFAHPLARPAWA